MKQFLKYVLATIVGVIIASLFVFFIINGLIIKRVSNSLESEDTKITPNSVLRINLNYPIPDQTPQDIFRNINWFTFSSAYRMGLNDIMSSIESASEDDNIKGIMIDMGISPNGLATLEEVRNALTEFSEGGKFVIAHGQTITQGSYYIGSAADEVFLSPGGLIEFKGFSAQITFLKEALDELGIETQIFYDGKFKSATEPFRLTEMSEENRLQLREFLTGVYDHYLQRISDSREVSTADLRVIADSLYGFFPILAKENGLVDDLKFIDEVTASIHEKLGLDIDSDVKYVSLANYFDARVKEDTPFKTGNLAVVYAEGDIVDGSGSSDNIGAGRMVSLLKKVRENDEIDAVVFRVNSPGGSALASDLIWRELQLIKKEKPLVVSMGNYAASGGYYIACPANKIVAQPNTLTGSIGVFMILPNMEKLQEDKLRLHFDKEMTSAHADFPNINRPVTEWEKLVLQASVDSTYLNFKRKIDEGREQLSLEQIENVAQGRIWTGTQALEKGLVDELGGLDKAIEIAAELASIENVKVREYPEAESKFMRDLIYSLANSPDAMIMESELGEYYEYLKILIKVKNQKGMQARIPYVLNIN